MSLGKPANDRAPNVRPVGYSHTTPLTLSPLKLPTISLPLLDPASGSREVKRAIELLSLARIVAKVHFSDCTGIPLESRIDDRTFKALFLDIGLPSTAPATPPSAVRSPRTPPVAKRE